MKIVGIIGFVVENELVYRDENSDYYNSPRHSCGQHTRFSAGLENFIDSAGRRCRMNSAGHRRLPRRCRMNSAGYPRLPRRCRMNSAGHRRLGG